MQGQRNTTLFKKSQFQNSVSIYRAISQYLSKLLRSSQAARTKKLRDKNGRGSDQFDFMNATHKHLMLRNLRWVRNMLLIVRPEKEGGGRMRSVFYCLSFLPFEIWLSDCKVELELHISLLRITATAVGVASCRIAKLPSDNQP